MRKAKVALLLLAAVRQQDWPLESEVIRKRSRFVRRGATGKGPSHDGTSLVAYSTSYICSGNGPVLHDGESRFARAILTGRSIRWPKGQFPPVLATCVIRRPQWACENPSCYFLLLADSREEEYNLKH